MKLSAIVCSYNRLRYLDGSIGSLMNQTLPHDELEIILVDNASTDGTAEWAGNRSREMPNLVYVYEPALGLSNARNAGWRAASSEFVAFLDDDAIADPRWAEAIHRKFARYNERLAVIGGRVRPLWESPPPEWLLPGLWAPLSMLDLAEHDLVMRPDDYFVGANMAMRKSALASVGGFSSALGRKGGRLLSNEEIYLKWQVERAGYYCLYAADVVARHSVPRERMSKNWFRKRYYWQGISDVLMRDAMNPAAGSCGGLARNLASTARFALDWAERRIRNPRGQPMAALCEESRILGMLVEDWRACLRRDNAPVESRAT